MPTDSMPIDGARAAPLEGLGGAPLNRSASARRPVRAEGDSREEPRADMRPDSVREAEEYARELLEMRQDDAYYQDEFYIDQAIVPEGWSYQWKASHIAGKENGYHILSLRRNGWKHVPASRHPEMMPDGWEGSIEKKGQFLMELPKILTDRANKAHIRESKDALRNSEAQLYETPKNTGPRDDPSVMRNINKITRETINPKQNRDD